MKYRFLLCAVMAACLIGGCANEKSADTATAAAEQTTAAPTTAEAAEVDANKTYDYEVREIWVDNDGEKIYGEAYIPKTEGRSPLILTSHGLGANHESGASYAKKYAPKGYAVYTWDFRGGSNQNHENRSDGDPKEMSVMTEVSDVEAILQAAKAWDFADTDRVYLQGGSQGGLVSAIAGVKHQDEIAGLILLYPAFGLSDLANWYGSTEIPDEIDISSMTVGRKYIDDLAGYDVRAELPDFEKPVLMLQGGDDSIVLPETTKAAAELLPDCEYHIIEGAGHGFSDEYHDEATAYALDFLYRHQ